MGTVFVCSLVFRLVGRIDLSLLFEAAEVKGEDVEVAELSLLLAAFVVDRWSSKPECRFSEFELDEEEFECGVWGGGLIELDELNRLLAAIPILEEDWARLRSIKIFLQMSLSALAMALAGTSQRNTWHM